MQETIVSGWYQPREGADLTKLATSEEHFVYIRGRTTIYSKTVEEKIQVDLACKGRDGYWHDTPRQLLGIESLDAYKAVEKNTLPWNQGEQWNSQNSWNRVPMSIIRFFAFQSLCAPRV